MVKEHLLSWTQEGNLSIPSFLLSNYKKLSLTETELVLLLQLLNFIDKGNDFPTPRELSERMTLNETDCTIMLSNLIRKGVITIEDGVNDAGIRYEKYSLQPLYERLIEQYLRNKNDEEILNKQAEQVDLYTTFEQEFGRPLSPYECETLAIWIDDDGHCEDIIKAALREAVISGRLNFRYIDRILFDWKRSGIKTVEQAREEGKRFRKHQYKKNEQQAEEARMTDPVPFYNWLEQ